MVSWAISATLTAPACCMLRCSIGLHAAAMIELACVLQWSGSLALQSIVVFVCAGVASPWCTCTWALFPITDTRLVSMLTNVWAGWSQQLIANKDTCHVHVVSTPCPMWQHEPLVASLPAEPGCNSQASRQFICSANDCTMCSRVHSAAHPSALCGSQDAQLRMHAPKPSTQTRPAAQRQGLLTRDVCGCYTGPGSRQWSVSAAGCVRRQRRTLCPHPPHAQLKPAHTYQTNWLVPDHASYASAATVIL